MSQIILNPVGSHQNAALSNEEAEISAESSTEKWDLEIESGAYMDLP